MTSVVTTGFISPSISGMQQDSREKTGNDHEKGSNNSASDLFVKFGTVRIICLPAYLMLSLMFRWRAT